MPSSASGSEKRERSRDSPVLAFSRVRPLGLETVASSWVSERRNSRRVWRAAAAESPGTPWILWNRSSRSATRIWERGRKDSEATAVEASNRLFTRRAARSSSGLNGVPRSSRYPKSPSDPW